MGVRNCKEIGENLQKIVMRLMANDRLINLLYYTDKDPLSKPHLSDEEKRTEIYDKLIKIIPRVGADETSHSIIAIRAMDGLRLEDNGEFKIVNISVEVFCPLTQWVIKDTNLRPFLILGEIQESLEDKKVNGLGKIQGGDFSLSFLTEEISCYEMTFQIISYD